ncbi:hypothetical protein DL767_010776 [Monosporascus sp. MG133]|nr:hypothetical protein DL767_010776 [Monosporascus sp. MG133]
MADQNQGQTAQYDAYQTSLTSRYCSPAMSQPLSQRSRHSTWRKLWFFLAQSEKELGIETITPEALEEMEAHLIVTDSDFEIARIEEKTRRHDVMAFDLKRIEQVRESLRFRGAQEDVNSDIYSFGGNSAKCDKLNKLLCQKDNFKDCRAVSTQTYSRTVDLMIANAVAGLGATAQKICGHIRHLTNWKEIEEPFESTHVGQRPIKGIPAHEQIRVPSYEAGYAVKHKGQPNDLVARMENTRVFKPIWQELDDILRPELYIGCSVEIVEGFCGEGGIIMEEKLKRYKDSIEKSTTAELNV